MITAIGLIIVMAGLCGMHYSARRRYLETQNHYRSARQDPREARGEPRPPVARFDHTHFSLIGSVVR